VLGNHDQPRAATRLARGRSGDREAIARAAAVLLLTLRGTPFLYYGEEIGLGDVPVPRWEMQDPPARRYWPLPVWFDRDRCRGPMPWTGGPHGGFTTGRPWLRLASDHPTRNVAAQAGDPASVLSLYRRMIRLRHRSSALTTGTFRWHVKGRDDVLAFVRESPGERVVVAIATSRRGGVVDLTPLDGRAVGLLSSHGPQAMPVIGEGRLRLRPLEAVVLRLE
jgi:alpha-glucosidase